MKTTPKKVLIACVILLTSFSVNSQVATLYTFSSFQGTYTPITTGGTLYNTSALDDEDILDPAGTTTIIPQNFMPPTAIGPGVDIGFNFVYDNMVFDRMGISNNGYIVLGNSADGANAIYESLFDWNRPISSTSATLPKNQHRIAPVATDLKGRNGSSIRVVTYGTAPTRSCVIQWADYEAYFATPTGADNINFQLWLYETSNTIDAVYGTFLSPTLDTCSQVGLRGGSNSDFNNRSVTGSLTWATSAAGTANNYFARYNTTLFPASGLTYRWALPQCSGALAAISTTAAAPSICPGELFDVTFQTYYPFAGVSYTWESSTAGAGGPYSTMPVPTITSSLTGITTSVPTWYQVSGTCIHSGSTVTATPYQITVDLVPTIGAIATPTALCSGSMITLTTTGNSATESWVGGYTSGTPFPATTSMNYTVIGTSVNGCTASASVPVTVTLTPTLAPIVTPSIVCIGGSGTLTAPGASSYTWASATNTVYTSSFVITPANFGTETYTVTKANGVCEDTKTISVITNSLPSVFAIATPVLICSLSQSTLAAAGGNTYTWTAPNFGPVVNQSPVVSPSVTTIYTVAASDGTCISTTTVQVATNPIPTITVNSSTTAICRGASVTMTATGANNYTWTSTANTNTLYTDNIAGTPTAVAAYNVTGDNSFGCTSSVSQFIQVYPNPTITVVVTKPLVCSGGLSTLTASGANTFTWDANANSAITPSTIVTTTALASGPFIYTVGGTYTISGCQSSKTVAVNVFVPVLTITGATNTCYGGNVNLSGSGGNQNTYSWDTGSGTPINFQNITASLTVPAVFTLSAVSNSGSVYCPATKTVQLGIYLNPTITAMAQRTVICLKSEKLELYGSGGVDYSWSNGMNGDTVTIGPINSIQALNFTVTGTDANGCVSTGTVQVKASGCNGIGELSGFSNSGVLIYPNPNNGQFTIKTDSDLILTLSNDLGQLVRTIELSAINNRQISISDLAKGIYFISGQGFNQKIIVSK